MLEIILNTSDPDRVLTVTENAKIIVKGDVQLKQIVCCNNCKDLIITGDNLTVKNTDLGIAIGNDGVFGLSYGRYYLPEFVTNITIDCKSIKTKTRIENCGIGAFGVCGIKGSAFTENCIVRDTPIDMEVILKLPSGSTKISETPKYVTKEELEAINSETFKELSHKLHLDKASNSLVNMFKTAFTELYQPTSPDNLHDSFRLVFTQMKDISQKLDAQTFAEGLLRVTASAFKAIIDCDFYCPSSFRHMMGMVYYIFLAQEIKLFPRIMFYPLSLRHYLVFYDATDNDKIEKFIPKSMASLFELDMRGDTAAVYYLPENLYGKVCDRFYWGISIYEWDDSYNEFVYPELTFEKGVINTNFKFKPRFKYAYAAGPSYLEPTAVVAALTIGNDKSTVTNLISGVTKEDFDGESNKILVLHNDVMRDLLQLF